MSKQYDEKLSLIGMLAELTWIDGEMSEEEVEFIDRLAELYKIEPIDLLKIKSGEFKPELAKPKNEADRIPFFQSCVMALGLDHKPDYDEKAYCATLGMKMGIREEVVKRVMDLFEEHFPNAVPVEKLMQAYNIGRN